MSIEFTKVIEDGPPQIVYWIGAYMKKERKECLLVDDYNDLFLQFEDHCLSVERVNFFHYIGFYELVNLNYLLLCFLMFCEKNHLYDLKKLEYGDKILDLYHLLDELLIRDV